MEAHPIIKKELELGENGHEVVVRKRLRRRVITGHYQQGKFALRLRSFSTVEVAGKCQRGIFTLEFLRSGTITPSEFLTFSNTDFLGRPHNMLITLFANTCYEIACF